MRGPLPEPPRDGGADADRTLGFLAGDGEMARRIREQDWAATPLGPPAQWSGPLRTALRLMLGTHHPVFVFWGPEHRCFYNDAYSASLGPEKHPSMLGRRGREAWQEVWPIIGPQVELVMAGRGATWHKDHLVPIMRHGALQEVYWTYSYSPIDDAQADSGVGGVLVLCNETTEQVLHRRALQDEQLRWRTLFDQAPGFACVLEGPEHRFRYANAGYLSLVGRRAQDLLGRRVAEVLPEVAEQGFVALLDSVRSSGRAHQGHDVEIVLAAPDGGSGRVVRLDFVYQPIRDAADEVSGVFVLGHDVTERERVRAERDATLQRLQAATEAAELGIHHWHIDGDRIDWDARVRALWRVAADAPIDYRTFIDGVHPDDRDAVQQAVDRALEPAGDGRYEAQFRVAGAGAQPPRWVRATGHVSFVQGRPVSLVGTVQDITRDRALLAQLAESDRLKDDFLAMLSHELRNPLAAIRNAGLVLGDARLADARAQGAREVIGRQCAHMAVLLDDLLDAARITRGKLHLQLRAVSLRDVLEQAIDAVRPAFDARAQRLDVALPPPQWTVHADPVRLTQVFGNLLGNAARYGRAGGHVQLRASRATASGEVQVVVADDGLGIASESLESIFELFTQAHREVAEAQGGLGIGLALVRGLLTQHGGRIEARSEGPGRGAEFVVTLPSIEFSAEAPAGAAAPAAVPDVPRRGLIVLLVDDNRDAAEMLGTLIGLEGHVVHVAHDGVAGLALARQCRPDVALLDIGLPGMDGHELAHCLRREPWAGSLRLAALTGWGQATDHRRARDAGFDVHLVKPVEMAQLQAVLAPPR